MIAAADAESVSIPQNITSEPMPAESNAIMNGTSTGVWSESAIVSYMEYNGTSEGVPSGSLPMLTDEGNNGTSVNATSIEVISEISSVVGELTWIIIFNVFIIIVSINKKIYIL